MVSKLQNSETDSEFFHIEGRYMFKNYPPTSLTISQLYGMYKDEIAQVTEDLVSGLIDKLEYNQLMKIINDCPHYYGFDDIT